MQDVQSGASPTIQISHVENPQVATGDLATRHQYNLVIEQLKLFQR